ncbi:unnamed protein product [Chironomus riparius]|uniref:Uncharacterized protein n=1 Tax=Chironomus riparius TaxID=315576 RepID=A0A9N9RYV8_9DIPT|nr:unnamed protein product [Chironomus riparius]
MLNKNSIRFIVVLLISVGDAGSKNNNESLATNHKVKQQINNTTQTPITHSVPMNFAKNDLLYLSELPLEQLLKVKKSIDEIQQVNQRVDEHPIGVVEETGTTESAIMESRIINDSGFGNEKRRQNGALPMAINQNLQQQQRQLTINRKTGFGGGSSGLETPWDSKPSKIQTFFQLSVTALAFLAFAGYLLCMIVQAIKAKGTTLLMSNTLSNASTSNTMNSLVNAGSIPLRRRRRPITVTGRRRKRNTAFLSSDNRNDTISSIYAESMNMNNPYDGDMYNAMISIAEGYVKLHFFE